MPGGISAGIGMPHIGHIPGGGMSGGGDGVEGSGPIWMSIVVHGVIELTRFGDSGFVTGPESVPNCPARSRTVVAFLGTNRRVSDSFGVSFTGSLCGRGISAGGSGCSCFGCSCLGCGGSGGFGSVFVTWGSCCGFGGAPSTVTFKLAQALDTGRFGAAAGSSDFVFG